MLHQATLKSMTLAFVYQYFVHIILLPWCILCVCEGGDFCHIAPAIILWDEAKNKDRKMLVGHWENERMRHANGKKRRKYTLELVLYQQCHIQTLLPWPIIFLSTFISTTPIFLTYIYTVIWLYYSTIHSLVTSLPVHLFSCLWTNPIKQSNVDMVKITYWGSNWASEGGIL